MDRDLDFYRNISGRYGLSIQFVMKEFRMMDILMQILQDKQLDIIFKGGTALNRIHFGGVSRFSEDLDFDEISDRESNERIDDLKKLMKSIKGYELEGPWKLHETIRFHCHYTNEFGAKDNVRAEFNLKLKKLQTVDPIRDETVRSEISGTTIIGVPTYAYEDLLARKMCALHDRTEGKDIYDVKMGLERLEDDNGDKLILAIGKVMKVEGIKGKPGDFIKTTIEKLKKTDPKQAKQMTNNYIPLSMRPNNWEELITSLVQRLEMLKPVPP